VSTRNYSKVLWKSPRDVRRLDMMPTVGVVEDVEDVLPLVMLDDVDHGARVQRSDIERERQLILHGLGMVQLTCRRPLVAEVTAYAAAQRLVDGGCDADDRKLERVGELGDDVRRGS